MEEENIQTTVNEDDIRNLVAEGVIENVYDTDESTDEMGPDVQ